jgi:hypothetical protein
MEGGNHSIGAFQRIGQGSTWNSISGGEFHNLTKFAQGIEEVGF